MNIYESIELLKTKLTEGNKSPDDLLYKVNVLIDPESDFTNLFPLVLIEAERTDFINAAPGQVVNQDHVLSITCIESAHTEDFPAYKSKVNQIARNTINKLMTIQDDNIQKIIPAELSHSEIMISSLKTSAVVIEVKIRTYWEDL